MRNDEKEYGCPCPWLQICLIDCVFVCSPVLLSVLITLRMRREEEESVCLSVCLPVCACVRACVHACVHVCTLGVHYPVGDHCGSAPSGTRRVAASPQVSMQTFPCWFVPAFAPPSTPSGTSVITRHVVLRLKVCVCVCVCSLAGAAPTQHGNDDATCRY